jgi:peptidase E
VEKSGSLSLNIALTSDLPSTANQAVLDLMRNRHPYPRIAWIAPFSSAGREHFPFAQNQFSAYGFSNLEYCDIDEEINETQLAAIGQYDVIYLSGGDPIRFRQNILRSGISTHLQQSLVAGCLLVAASGGSMQLTRNVSLFRLLSTPLDRVLAERREFDALGIVDYEILPHVNRLESSYLDKVRFYSEQIDHDVLGLADGAALLYKNSNDYLCVGQVTRFRKGEVSLLETA